MAALVFIKHSAEYRGRIEIRPEQGVIKPPPTRYTRRPNLPAHEVNAAVDAHHGTRVHISNQPIILNWQVASGMAVSRLHG